MDRLLFVLFPPNLSVIVGQLLIFMCPRFAKVRQKFPLLAKNFLTDLKFPHSQATRLPCLWTWASMLIMSKLVLDWIQKMKFAPMPLYFLKNMFGITGMLNASI